MTKVSEEEIGRTFFACGWVSASAGAGIEEKLSNLGDRLVKMPIGEQGFFFYNQPFYADIAENQDQLVIKLGHVHDGKKLLPARELLERGLVGHPEFKLDQFSGSASLIVLNKHEPKLSIFRNLLSTFEIKYWSQYGNLVVSDNLRMMSLLLPRVGVNQAAVPQHFIYRTVYGRQTYLEHVQRLLAGERFDWDDGKGQVDLLQDLRGIQGQRGQLEVNQASVAIFFELFERVTGVYLQDNQSSSATMLSGGVDSSLIQAALNSHTNGTRFPTFSFSVDSPEFSYEVEYASQAVDQLATDHEFVRVSASDYRESLVNAIQLLGQPLPDDVRPCFLALTREIADRHPQLETIFHGQIADGLHGVGSSLEVVQGDKYHRWPPFLLDLLGGLLSPISQSKSYGARTAARVLRTRKDLKSPHQFLNAVGLYTDWDTVLESFSGDQISQACTMKRVLGYHYLDTELLVEQLNVLDLMTDGIDPACVVNQFGLFYGKQIVFPYSDQSIVEATFAFDPRQRYTYGHRAKPILKAALESRLPGSVTSQPKGWSGMGEETLFKWMRDGELADLVQDIERPGFMKQSEFEKKINQPDWFTWNLLTFDVFKKEILGN